MDKKDQTHQQKHSGLFDYFVEEILPKALEASCKDQLAMLEKAKKIKKSS